MKQPIDSAKKVGQATTGAIAKTAGFFTSALIGLGKEAFHPLRRETRGSTSKDIGAAPGIERYITAEKEDVPVKITCIDYGPEAHQVHHCTTIGQALSAERKVGVTVRWINVDGLSAKMLDEICKKTNLHPLAAEDILLTNQRPKVEKFDDHLLVILRQIQVKETSLNNEQVSLLCFHDMLITFQEIEGDVFNSVRKRIEKEGSRFRTNKADYLLYALIDSLVDHLFPLLEGYGMAMDELEEEISHSAPPESQKRLFSLKRDLSLLRRSMWPVREVVDSLYRDESGLIADHLKPFFRDVQDHATQVLELLETFRETASSLHDLYQSSVANRMNEVMKVLTIMASFFIPITFIAGVYGMNFEYIPELGWHYSYFVFWAICLSVTAGLAIYFWRKGWIRKG